MSIREGVWGNYRLFGIRGLLAVSSLRVLGRPREISIHPALARYPVHLRLRTSDVSVYNDALLRGEYSLEMPEFCPKTVVDAGANIGMASLYYAHTYPHAKIVAVEPESSNYALLLKNVSPYPNIIPIHAALWNKDGSVNIGQPEVRSQHYSKWAFRVVSNCGIQVRSVTMPSLMAETGIDSIDLLKVDIEGGEKEVFEHCDWMDRVQVMVIELHDRIKPGCKSAVVSAAQGFQSLERGEMTFFFRTRPADLPNV